MDPLDTKSSASLYTGAELNLRDRVVRQMPGLGGGVGDGHSGLMPSSKLLCPNLGKIVGSIIIIVQRGCDQLVDVLLMGWLEGR